MNFVTQQIAQKLKDKGFKEKVNGYYHKEKEYLFQVYPARDMNYSDNKYSAPTISQVLKWLREEKEIDIVIEPIFFYDDNYDRTRNYNCVIFAPQLNNPKHCVYYDKWEESAIAGIEYTLENLI